MKISKIKGELTISGGLLSFFAIFFASSLISILIFLAIVRITING